MGYFVPPRYLIRRIIVLAGCLLGIGLVSSWWLGAGLAVGSGDEIAAERGEPHLDDLGSSELTPARAAALAVNELTPLAEGYHLEHPRYRATFNAAGLTFQPRPGGPRWQWRLEAIGAGEAVLPGVILDPVRPEQNQPWRVSYPRGGIIEEYWARLGHIEQRFVIPEPLALHGADLTIAGIIQTAGEFEATAGGWLWRAGAGAVRLGQARVFDAAGQDIPVTFRVTAGRTRLVVDGAALARATYPVIIDPPIGSQFRISEVRDLVPQGDSRKNYDAFNPAVAYGYDGVNDRYLIVWSGDNVTDDDFGIYGQIIDANENVITDDFAIRTAVSGEPAGKDKDWPAVALGNNQYLVVWQEGKDTFNFDGEDLINNNKGDTNLAKQNEIYGQFVGLAGNLITQAFRISNMSDSANTGDAFEPAVAYNSQQQEYLVVWSGDANEINKFLIYGQRIDAATRTLIGNDFPIAQMNILESVVQDAIAPDVTYNTAADEYFVVWSGSRQFNNNLSEMEIFGRVVKADGTFNGTLDVGDGAGYRISTMGADGDFAFDAFAPAVTYNSLANEYLVVWSGDETTDGNFAIYGARVTTNMSGGVNPPVSQIGISPPGLLDNPLDPVVDVAYSADSNQYLVTWSGDEVSAGDFEIQWRLLAGNGGVISPTVYEQISAMNNSDQPSARTPALAYGTGGKYLVVWSGTHGDDGLENKEYEIYGRFFTTTASSPNEPNLTLTKSASPPNPDLGDTITYMIVVTNSGGADATGALIADPLPPDLVFQPGSIILTATTGTAGITPTNLATGVTIPAGQSVTVTFQAKVTNPAAAGTTIMNTAAVTSAEIASPATGLATIDVTPLPLVLTKTAPSKAILGRVITYTVVVANDGPGNVNNVVLVDTLPPGVSLAGVPTLDPPLGTVVDITIPTIQADIPALAENQRITMTIPVSVSAGLTAGGYITNTASVTSVEVTIPITDEASSLLTEPGLDLEKIASATVVTPGQTITYTVVVTNTGDDTSGVVIVDTLPLSVTLAGTPQLVPALPGSNVDTTALPDIVATIPFFASNESVQLIIPVQTDSNLLVNTHLINTAGVTSLDVTDPVTDAVEVTIVDPNGPPAFEAQKTVSFAEPAPGSSVTYTISINNNGGIATNALISDTLPAGLTLAGPVSLDPPGIGVVDTTNPPLLSIAAPVINSLQNITITFPVAIDPGLSAGTRLTNTVAITSEDAPIPEVDAVSITIREPALAITKTASLATANLGQTINYTYQVVNTGSAPLSNFMVNDDRLGAINLNTTILNPTEQAVGLATYTVAAGDFPGPLVNTVVVSAAFAGTIVTATDSASVDVLPPFIYLPMIMKKENGPDLVGTFTLTPNKTNFAAGEPVQITAEVTNIGNQPADSFWVDLYINPGSTPDVNIPWNNTCTLNPCYGVAWFVESGLQPGQSLQLTSTPGSYSTGHTIWPGSFASGTTNLFLYVDSWNPTVSAGAVAESDESNNLFGYNPLSVTGVSLTDDAVAQPQPAITSTQTTTRPAVIK